MPVKIMRRYTDLKRKKKRKRKRKKKKEKRKKERKKEITKKIQDSGVTHDLLIL
jgi:hypothetical protein